MTPKVTRRDFPPEYFDVVVSIPREPDVPRNVSSTSGLDWPAQFGVISAFATTGEVWPEQVNRDADQRLHARLRQLSNWIRRLEVASPDRAHCEPSWAVALPWEAVCDLGQEFLQRAVYYIVDDAMHVTFCDARRQLVPMGSFRNRIQLSSV